jgi:hypothetical protein
MNCTKTNSAERVGTSSFADVSLMRSSQPLRKIKSEAREVRAKFLRGSPQMALVGDRIERRAGPSVCQDLAEHVELSAIARNTLNARVRPRSTPAGVPTRRFDRRGQRRFANGSVFSAGVVSRTHHPSR